MMRAKIGLPIGRVASRAPAMQWRVAQVALAIGAELLTDRATLAPWRRHLDDRDGAVG
jgi:hypothetical protein